MKLGRYLGSIYGINSRTTALRNRSKFSNFVGVGKAQERDSQHPLSPKVHEPDSRKLPEHAWHF